MNANEENNEKLTDNLESTGFEKTAEPQQPEDKSATDAPASAEETVNPENTASTPEEAKPEETVASESESPDSEPETVRAESKNTPEASLSESSEPEPKSDPSAPETPQDKPASESAEPAAVQSETPISETKTTPESSPTVGAGHPAVKEEDEDEGVESEEDEEEEVEDEYYGIPVRAYDEMNLDALGEELERLLRGHDIKEIRNHVREIKTEFDVKFDTEREQSKKDFLEKGGNIIDFSYSIPAEQKFNKLYFEYKEKRDEYYKKVRKNLQENLERRLAIIEELKALTGVGTDMNANFKSFRNLQDRWRKAGPVPRNDYKNTWNTYHYHVERFYEFLHLDREFREMDYQYNLKQKLKMIARAEELTQEKNVNRAFRELQNLHRMWKEEVGPVSQEYSDAIWEKFSEATRQIHENRRAFFAERDKKREVNFEAKQEIIDQIATIAEEKEFKSHKEAQQKIKKVNQLRDEFFKIGKVPLNKNEEIWNAFKTATRDFNHKKNNFYKERKETFKENLEMKMELIKIAEENKDSDDFDTVTPLMKKIQSDWKKIGYVPRGKSDKIWKRFKKACNHYFDRLHAERNKENQAEVDAFHKKAAMLKEVLELQLSGKRDEDLSLIKSKIKEWKGTGRVPRNKQHIEGKFNKALDALFSELDINKQEAELLKYDNFLQSINENDEGKIRREAAFLYKKIDQTKDEIIQLETNLQFFDKVDKNNPLMKGTFRNIEQLKQQLEIWKAKLDKLNQL